MDELVQWLCAQLDVDEAKARACAGNGEWTTQDIAIFGPDLSPEVRGHMAEHDPARVLREIDARRGVLTYVETAIQESRHRDYLIHGPAKIALTVLEPVVRHLAAAYADRPGFRPEWAADLR